MKYIPTIAAAVLFSAPASFADEDGHPELVGAVKTFHDVLKVDWHAEPGAERNANACRNTGDYITHARNITTQDSPDGASTDTWSATSYSLLDASIALGAYCLSANDANVEAGLSTLHDRFHDLMKLMKAKDQ